MIISYMFMFIIKLDHPDSSRIQVHLSMLRLNLILILFPILYHLNNLKKSKTQKQNREEKKRKVLNNIEKLHDSLKDAS
jgi:hypothetical protein